MGRLMDFRILGPLEELADVGPVELAGGKQNALPALLLILLRYYVARSSLSA